MKRIRRPGFLKSRRRKSAEKRARIIRPILDRARRSKSNGHNP